MLKVKNNIKPYMQPSNIIPKRTDAFISFDLIIVLPFTKKYIANNAELINNPILPYEPKNKNACLSNTSAPFLISNGKLKLTKTPNNS